MASSDSGVESIDILNDNKDDGTHNRNANVGTPSESSSSEVTVSPHSTRRDIIVCGDCHHEFPISQFSIFMDHKVIRFFGVFPLTLCVLQMSRCDGKQTPSDDVASIMVDSPGDSAFTQIARRGILVDHHNNVKREIGINTSDAGLFFCPSRRERDYGWVNHCLLFLSHQSSLNFVFGKMEGGGVGFVQGEAHSGDSINKLRNRKKLFY